MESQYLVCALMVILALTGNQAYAITAQCDVQPNSAGTTQNVRGMVTLTQDSAGGDTTIVVSLSGFSTTDSDTFHGFHIHGTGDISGGCGSSGGHYNPLNQNHGAPTASVRHVGDLGNIEESSSGTGTVSTTITDSVVSLSGDYSVLYRAIVVHAGRDDLGLGGDAESIITGNAGARLACCVINQTTEQQNGASYIASHNALLLVPLVVLLKLWM